MSVQKLLSGFMSVQKFLSGFMSVQKTAKKLIPTSKNRLSLIRNYPTPQTGFFLHIIKYRKLTGCNT